MCARKARVDKPGTSHPSLMGMRQFLICYVPIIIIFLKKTNGKLTLSVNVWLTGDQINLK